MRKKGIKLISFLLCTIMVTEMVFANGMFVKAAGVSEEATSEESGWVEEVSEEFSEAPSEELSEEPSEDASEELSEEPSEVISEEPSEVLSEKPSEELPEAILEETPSEVTEESTAEDNSVLGDETGDPINNVLPERVVMKPGNVTLKPTEMVNISFEISPAGAVNHPLVVKVTDKAASEPKELFLNTTDQSSTKNSADNRFDMKMCGKCLQILARKDCLQTEDATYTIEIYPYIENAESYENPIGSAEIIFKAPVLAKTAVITEQTYTVENEQEFRLFTEIAPVNTTNTDVVWKVYEGDVTFNANNIDRTEANAENIENKGNGVFAPHNSTTSNKVFTITAYVRTRTESEADTYIGSSCKVTVKAERKYTNLGFQTDVLTNVTPTLGDVKLDEDWEWVEPGMKLKDYTGGYIYAAAEYTGEYYKNRCDYASLCIGTIQGVEFDTTEKNLYNQDGCVTFEDIKAQKVDIWKDEDRSYPNVTFTMKYKVTGKNIKSVVYTKGEDNREYTQASDYTQFREADSISVTTSTFGTVSVTAELTILKTNGNNESPVVQKLTKTEKFSSVKSMLSDIVLTNEQGVNVDIPARFLEGEKKTIPYQKPKDGKKQTFVIKAFGGSGSGVANPTFKLTSSNSKIATVGKVETVNGISKAVVTVKDSGCVTFTAIGNDVMKSSKSFKVVFADYTPIIGAQKADLNTVNESNGYSVEYDFFSLYSSDLYEFTVDNAFENSINVKYDFYSLKVSLVKNSTSNSLTDNPYYATNKTVYIPLTFKYRADGEIYTSSVELPVKCKATPVKAVSKITEKLNLFYNDSLGKMEVACDGVTDMSSLDLSLTECDYVFKSNKLTEENGKYYIKFRKKSDAEKDKAGVLTITQPGSSFSIVQNVTIGTCKTVPKIKCSDNKLSVNLNLKDKTCTTPLVYGNGENIETDCQLIKQETQNDYVTLSLSADGPLRLVVSPTNRIDKFKGGKVTFTLQRPNWNAPIKLSVNVSVVKQNYSLKVSQPTIVLNCNDAFFETECGETMLTAGETAQITIAGIRGGNAASVAILENGMKYFVQDKSDNHTEQRLCFFFNKKVAKGTYKFKVEGFIQRPDTNTTENISTVITVKVVDIVPAKALSVKVSGSIDLFKRDTTSYVYMPKMNGISGKIIEGTLVGPDATMFNGNFNAKDGSVNVYASTEEYFYLKKTYQIAIQYKFKTPLGEKKVITALQKVKLKQTKRKYKVECLQTAYPGRQEKVYSQVKIYGNMNIYECIVDPSYKYAHLFTIETNGEIPDIADMSVNLNGELKAGTTYSVPVLIYSWDGAIDGEPAKAMLKFKLMK